MANRVAARAETSSSHYHAHDRGHTAVRDAVVDRSRQDDGKRKRRLSGAGHKQSANRAVIRNGTLRRRSNAAVLSNVEPDLGTFDSKSAMGSSKEERTTEG